MQRLPGLQQSWVKALLPAALQFFFLSFKPFLCLMHAGTVMVGCYIIMAPTTVTTEACARTVGAVWSQLTSVACNQTRLQ